MKNEVKKNFLEELEGSKLKDLMNSLFDCINDHEARMIIRDVIINNFTEKPLILYLKSLITLKDMPSGLEKENIISARIHARKILENLDLEKINSIEDIKEIVFKQIKNAESLKKK